ncbi:hypothetical protein CsatB_009907 [Cannabis sativa]
MNALTDPQRVQTPSIAEYWKPLAEDMDPAAGIEAEYHHKNNRVCRCIAGKVYGFQLDRTWRDFLRAKRAKKEEAKGSAQQGEENQISTHASENDEGIRGDLEASTTPMDAEPEIAGVTAMVSQGGSPMPDENQKQSSDTDAGPEMGQLEADSEAEAGIIEGEVDLDAAS